MSTLTFAAAHLAPAWLSVFQAAGTEAALPAFYRSVAIEWFPTGVRLVASDQTVLLHAWVPSLDDIDADPPTLDEVPKAVTTALDWNQRAKGLLSFAWKIARKQESDVPTEITLSVEEADDEVPQGRLDLEVPGDELVVLDLPGQERVRLQIFQGEWPDWRVLGPSFVPEATNAVALNPAMVGRLAKLGSFIEGPLIWAWGGSDRLALVRIGSRPVEVNGYVMPYRLLGIEDEAPAAEPTSTVPDYDGEA